METHNIVGDRRQAQKFWNENLEDFTAYILDAHVHMDCLEKLLIGKLN